MVKSGLSLTCKTCDLKDWYSLEQISGDIICNGCNERIKLPLQGIHFSYKANELLHRFVDTGGYSVFATANILKRLDPTGALHFGGDLYQNGERTNFAEVDLFWLNDDLLSIVECKSYKQVRKEDVTQFKIDLNNLINRVAVQIDAKLLFFGVFYHDTCDSSLYKLTAQIATKAKRKGLGFHLIVNGHLYPWGTSVAIEQDSVKLHDLVYKKPRQRKPKQVGEQPTQWSFGGLTNAINDDIARKWLEQYEQTGA